MENVQPQPFNWSPPIAVISAVASAVALASLFGPASFRFIPPNGAVILFTATLFTGAYALGGLSLKKRGEAPGDDSAGVKREYESNPKPIPLNDPQVEERLKTYLQKHPTTIEKDVELNTILSWAKEGQELVEKMMNGEKVQVGTKKDLHNAISVIWYLTYAQLAKEGRGYDAWMWKIEDPDGKLTEFFQGLDGAYPRVSTHFNGQSLGKQMGYDFDSVVLPAGKRTVLIIPLDPAKYGEKQLLGLKLEEYGTGSATHIAGHTKNYLRSLIRKALGGNDTAGRRTEHLPKHLKPFAKTYGTKRVCELAVHDNAKEAMEGMDAKKVRDGNEVILKKKHLV